MKTIEDKINILIDMDNKLNDIIQGENFLSNDENINLFFKDIFRFNEILIEVKKEFTKLDNFNIDDWRKVFKNVNKYYKE